MRSGILAALLSTLTLPAQDSTPAGEWLNRGIEAYKSARFQEAVDNFQKAVYLNPNDVKAHLYLGTAWMSLYIPSSSVSRSANFANPA